MLKSKGMVDLDNKMFRSKYLVNIKLMAKRKKSNPDITQDS